MNSKFEKLNEKISLLSKYKENNEIKKRQEFFDDIGKLNDEKQSKFYNTCKISQNIDQNIILKGKIETLKEDYISKISKFQKKYDNLLDEFNKISSLMNNNFELEENYTKDLFEEINNIKNNLSNSYLQENNSIEELLEYFKQNLSNQINSIYNYNTSEILENKENIFDLDKFTEEIVNKVKDKINEINLVIDIDKHNISQNICTGLIKEDEYLKEEVNISNNFYNTLKYKLDKFTEEVMNIYVNREKSKINEFKYNIEQLLNETLKNIIIKNED